MQQSIPKYRLHKATGNAVVTLNGKDCYLGKHDTPESRAKYDRKISEWIARGRQPEIPRGTASVSALLAAYVRHAETYYVKSGYPTSQLAKIHEISGSMNAHFGDAKTSTVELTDFLSLRNSWINSGKSRTTVNSYFRIAREFFRWGVEHQLVPASVWYGLQAVKGLRKGRSACVDHDPVKPADLASIEAVVAISEPDVVAMIQLQLVTGMRPGEVVTIRPCDVDRSGLVWFYTPEGHKTEHHGKSRKIAIGPKGLSILGPWLDKAKPDGLAFPPSAKRWSQVKGKKKMRPDRKLAYSYAVAIRKACKLAKVEHWTPNQLRHNAATAIRKAYGIEHASVVLGHSKVDTTEIYAERDMEKAARIALEMG